MEQANKPLPTPRHLLTSVINTLTTVPQMPPTNEPYSAPTNPLKSLLPSHRALLTTLHVLFPTGMILQSLDLLDRGLVTRITLSSSSPPDQIHLSPNQQAADRLIFPPQVDMHLPPALRDLVQGIEGEGSKEGNAVNGKGRENTIYKVTSSQPQKSRFSHSGAGSGQVYTVRLGAWNCSCAAFTFSAFPGAGASSTSITSCKPWETVDEDLDGNRSGVVGQDLVGDRGDEEEWEFGGLSLDGKEGEGVPVCKHLLACLLGDRWGDVMGGLVKEKEVGREEMAGLGAD